MDPNLNQSQNQNSFSVTNPSNPAVVQNPNILAYNRLAVNDNPQAYQINQNYQMIQPKPSVSNVQYNQNNTSSYNPAQLSSLFPYNNGNVQPIPVQQNQNIQPQSQYISNVQPTQQVPIQRAPNLQSQSQYINSNIQSTQQQVPVQQNQNIQPQSQYISNVQSTQQIPVQQVQNLQPRNQYVGNMQPIQQVSVQQAQSGILNSAVKQSFPNELSQTNLDNGVSNLQQVQNSKELNSNLLQKSNIPTPIVKTGRSILDMLFSENKINQEQLEASRFEIISKGLKEEAYIKSKGLANDIDILNAKSKLYNVPFIDITSIDIKKDYINKIKYEIAKNNQVIAFGEDRGMLKVAMEDPLDIQKLKYLQTIVGMPITGYFAVPDHIRKMIDTKYTMHMETEVNKAIEDVKAETLSLTSEISNYDNLDLTVQNAPIARIVSTILEYGARFKASDVHIEPREGKVSVRYRTHGILAERISLPLQVGPAVISRIKILSNLKIDEHRIPQDGRFEMKTKDQSVDLRVSVMPTVFGEKIVIRFLDKTGGVFPLEQTGLRGSAYKTYKEAIKATQGIILVTGPTGSGKTVTLASTLSILNKPEVNIVTLEDPVEIRVDGVNQVQVNSEVGLTFATGLRAFLRQDPDVIMVGEIRDKETASLAVQAALVGRLVLATLHTNSAAGALPRLLDMSAEPYLLASVINIIVAQRLPRKICEYCKEEYIASDEVTIKIHTILDGIKISQANLVPMSSETPEAGSNDSLLHAKDALSSNKIKLYRGKGCEKCNGSGYLGRIGIFEVLKMNEKIAKMVMSRSSTQEIHKLAVEEGMITMIQDGFIKALEGITTIEEVLRVQS